MGIKRRGINMEEKQLEMEKDDLESALDEVHHLTEAEEKKKHEHQQNYGGASNLDPCVWLEAQKRAGIPLPKMIGIKSDMGAAREGKDQHDKESKDAENWNKLHPESPKKFGHDLMVSTPLTPNYTIESELDIISIKNGETVKIPWEFKETKETYALTEGAEIDTIWDIKSKDSNAYWSTVYNAKQGKIPMKWKTQFMAYLKSTGKTEMKVQIKDRSFGNKFTFVFYYDPKIWDYMVKLEYRVEDVANQLKENPLAPIELTPDDLLIFRNDLSNEESESDDIEFQKCWRYCPLSLTHEERAENERPSLKMDKPCEPAIAILEEIASKKFSEGQKWQYGLNHLTITRIDLEVKMIFGINKGGKEFSLTYCEAAMEFGPIKERKKKE